jgi:hypothetical protein
VTEPQPPEPTRPGSSVGRGAVVAFLGVALVAGGLVVAVALVWLGPARTSSAAGPGTAGPADAGPLAETGVGASSDGYTVWDRNDDGTPVRWDPCSPIDVVVDPRDAPSGALDDLEIAIERLVRATGLTVRVTGTTDERPRADRPPYQPDRYGDRWAPVLVTWAAPHEGGIRLRSTDRGVALPVAVGPVGDRTYVTAQVALNAERHDLVPGFEDRSWSWGSTLLHELAHAVGLDHVDDPAELMYVHPGEGPVEFGPGDRAGLEAVGAEHGCREVPRPQHVEVAVPAP